MKKKPLLMRWGQKIRSILWPGYECVGCVGQNPWEGCYCQYQGAWGPCDQFPPRWVRLGRFIFRNLEPKLDKPL